MLACSNAETWLIVRPMIKPDRLGLPQQAATFQIAVKGAQAMAIQGKLD